MKVKGKEQVNHLNLQLHVLYMCLYKNAVHLSISFIHSILVCKCKPYSFPGNDLSVFRDIKKLAHRKSSLTNMLSIQFSRKLKCSRSKTNIT